MNDHPFAAILLIVAGGITLGAGFALRPVAIIAIPFMWWISTILAAIGCIIGGYLIASAK